MEDLNDRSIYDVFFKVIRLHYHRMHKLLDKEDIYPGQPPLLFILYHHDGLSQKELADKLKIKPATLTVMIQRMEKVGYLEKKQDENDQRVTHVFLTDKGKEAFLQVKDLLKDFEHVCFINFTDEEKLLFRRLLLQMIDNLNNEQNFM